MPRIANAQLYKPYAIENAKMSHATVLPSQTMGVEFDVHSNAGVLTDLTTAAIVVKDPANSTRVLYASGSLTNISTGKYTYPFTMPADVLEGDWHVNISVTVSGSTTVRNVHFTVEEV